MWLVLTAALFTVAFGLVKYPRQTLYALGGLIGLIVAGVSYLSWSNTKSEKEREQRAASVSVAVAHDQKRCSDHHPLAVVIRNHSDSIVNKVTWRYQAFAPGRSTNLIKYEYFDGGSSNRIIRPDTVVSLCYVVPELEERIDPATLQWSALTENVVFADKP